GGGGGGGGGVGEVGGRGGGGGVVGGAGRDGLGAKLHVLHHDFHIPLELDVGRQKVVIHLQDLDPIDRDVGLFACFVMGFSFPTFFFRREIRSPFVRLDLRLALFSFEPIVLVTQTLIL